MSRYVIDEKVAIASGYLGPQAKEVSGLGGAVVQVEDAAIDRLAKYILLLKERGLGFEERYRQGKGCSLRF